MSDEKKELGELLHAKRAELKLSLKEIENATSIRMGYLEAIEEGKISHCVSGIYAQGFMKQYAAFLGFDPNELVDSFPSAFHVSNERHEFSYGIGTLEVRSAVGGGVKWLPILLWGGISIAVLCFAWYVVRIFDLI
jgi:cytoskeletal protein RodZ